MGIKIAALTGAGISKASGIPTFVEMGDLRDKLSREYFNEYPEDFYKILNQMKSTIDNAKPNPAHLALAKYNIPIVTMNIDGLHIIAGSREKDIVEIHGNLRKVFCSKCGRWYDFEVTGESIFCKDCKDIILQPDVVLYGDMIPKLYEAINLVKNIDLLLVIGTSFYTSTASYITDAARSNGAKVKILNEEAEDILPAFLDKLLDEYKA